MSSRTQCSTPFPYTTLFRSLGDSPASRSLGDSPLTRSLGDRNSIIALRNCSWLNSTPFNTSYPVFTLGTSRNCRTSPTVAHRRGSTYSSSSLLKNNPTGLSTAAALMRDNVAKEAGGSALLVPFVSHEQSDPVLHTLSLHDALPIFGRQPSQPVLGGQPLDSVLGGQKLHHCPAELFMAELHSLQYLVPRFHVGNKSKLPDLPDSGPSAGVYLLIFVVAEEQPHGALDGGCAHER